MQTKVIQTVWTKLKEPGQMTRFTDEERSVYYSACGMKSCRETTAESEAKVRALACLKDESGPRGVRQRTRVTRSILTSRLRERI